MNILQAIILGIIQGATEFIPVSSSGHLVLVREFLGWKDLGISFDIALHLGTLIAIIFYFRSSWRTFLVNLGRKRILKNRLFWGLIIATLPAVVVGYFCEGLIVKYFRAGFSVGVWMIILGIIFILVEKWRGKSGEAKSKSVLSWKEYLLIGLAQSIALIPGVSRSGATIAAGMSRKLARREAAEFSFLLAVPAILGAGIYDFLSNYQSLNLNFLETAIGFFAALIIGYASIRFLMHFLARHSLNPFAYYLIGLGMIALIFALWR